jgi:NAD+ synthase
MAGSELTFDVSKETSRITAFIRRVVAEASAKGAVVGLSGGIDSSVTGALCVRALGKENVLGLLMPSDHTPKVDVRDAVSLAETWRIRSEQIPISKAVRVLTDAAKISGTKIARANVEARVRMVISYYYANTIGYLVAGTDDKSEGAIGFYTKFGDGGVDFLPISHLYKTQVRELGGHLGIPTKIVQKPASPQLWPGHRATDEIPADYDRLDIALHYLFDLKRTPREAAVRAGIPPGAVEKILQMHRRSEHKRKMPPSLG